MLRPTKRQRLECPLSWMDCESLAKVPSADGFVTTSVADDYTPNIFLERFQKEIVERLKYSLSSASPKSPSRIHADQNEPSSEKPNTSHAVTERIVVGVNACTKLLQDALDRQDSSIDAPLLIVCCDVPNLLSHIPVFAKQMKVPILLLPIACCRKLGRMIGIQRASIIVFVKRNTCVKDSKVQAEDDEVHKEVDSFVDFVCSNLVSPSL
jgi:ribosomal protein L7Ae-like RNA K-turn-binding protein